MQPEVELVLITKVKETLCLKRTRLLLGHDITEEEKETQFKKMKESSDLSEATADLMNVRYNFDNEMAEEAGLTMPQPLHEYTQQELSGCGCGSDNERTQRHMQKTAAIYYIPHGDQSPQE